MLRVLRLPSVVVFAVFAVTVPLLAQGLSADEKELAVYKLTLPMLNKVVAAMRSMAAEAQQDPKFQQAMKLDAQIDGIEAQIEKLTAKEAMTPAEEAKVESLNEQLDKLRAQQEQLEEADSDTENVMSNAKTLTEMEQGFRKVPMFARALERQGLSPREFAKFMLAMLQAGMVHGFSQGKVDYAKLPAGINPENVKFIENHKAELDAMQKEFAAMDPRRKK